MRYLQVKNWKKHQHYKGRRPPWIKLYGDVFTDHDFASLSDLSKLHLMAIWILARMKDGIIPEDPAWIRKAAGLDSDVDLKPMIDKGLLVVVQDASDLLASCPQVPEVPGTTCPPEKSREETEERRGDAEADENIAAIRRHDPTEILNPFPEKSRQPALQSAIEYQIRRYRAPMPSASWYPSLLNEAGTLFEVQEDPVKALEIFVTACKTKPTTALPRDATYSQIAEHCGLKRNRFTGPPPWEASKKKEESDSREQMFEFIKTLGLPKG